MKTLATSTDINACIKSTRTWFSTDTTPDSTQTFQRWSYSTRDNGDIENETPGQEDIREARRLQAILEGRFKNVRATVGTCDECTNLEISLYPHRIPTRPPISLDLYQAPSANGGHWRHFHEHAANPAGIANDLHNLPAQENRRSESQIANLNLQHSTI